MLNKNILFSSLKYSNSAIITSTRNILYNFNYKKNFDQFKERPKRHFILLYKFIEDMHYKRVPFREDHQKLIEQYEQQGSVIIGGKF
jgi:hypothetical protein